MGLPKPVNRMRNYNKFLGIYTLRSPTDVERG